MLDAKEVTSYSVTDVRHLNQMEINGLIMMAAYDSVEEAGSCIEDLCWHEHSIKYSNINAVVITSNSANQASIIPLGVEGIRVSLSYKGERVSVTFTIDELIDWGLI